MMDGEGSEKSGDARVEKLLEDFLRVQMRRAEVYNLLRRGFTDYLKTSSEGPYQELCGQVTRDFSDCSKQVLDIEAALNDRLDRPDLASVLRSVQLQEKQKLQMTATLQVLRRAGRPSERLSAAANNHDHSTRDYHNGAQCSHNPESDTNTGLEMAQLEAEYDAAIKEATGILQDVVMAINEHIEEVRYGIEELGQRRQAASTRSPDFVSN